MSKKKNIKPKAGGLVAEYVISDCPIMGKKIIKHFIEENLQVQNKRTIFAKK